MTRLKLFLQSTIGRKYLMAVTGLSLVGFVVTHLGGNLSLYFPDGSVFNQYAHSLFKLGPLLIAAEAGLIAIFVLHLILAILIKVQNRAARPVSYESEDSKGGPTKGNLASRHMIVTGVLLLIFVVLHVWHFKFGPGMDSGYSTEINGEEARDLFAWVTESFQDPKIVGGYLFAMLILGMHLRHGVWSMFQSLGFSHPVYNNCLHKFALVFSIVITLGFAGIPLWIYFDCAKHFTGGY